MSPPCLRNRTILLTGASGYLGTSISKAILDAGATLVVSGRRVEALRALRDEFEEPLRARCHVVSGDIGNPEGVFSLCRDVSSLFESIHGIVNNAYSGRVGHWQLIEAEDFLFATQLNMIAPFLLVRELLPKLERGAREAAGGASIVNITSMYGSVSPDPSVYGATGLNNPVHYGASKGALIQLTRYLACHLAPRGLRVNSVSPGPIPRAPADAAAVDLAKKLAAKVPMGRVGRPEEVGGPVVFLLSGAASYVNGANLAVDGGWTAW